jgi:hypothetical protein
MAEVTFVVALFVLAPWLKSTMSLEKKDESNRAQEIKARLQQKQKAEKARRQKMTIAKEDIKKLKKDKEDKAKQEMKRKVKTLAKVHREMKKERKQREEMLKQRSKKEMMVHKARKTEKTLKDMSRQADVLKRDATDSKDQDNIKKKIEELQALNEDIKNGQEESIRKLQEETQRLVEQLKELRQKQEEAANDPSQQKEMGLPGHTAWLQKLIKPLEQSAQDMAQMGEGMNDMSSLPTSEDLPSSDLDQMDLQSLYDEAMQMEQAISNDFQASKKMEVAMREGMSVAEAAASLMGTTPERPQQDFQKMGQSLNTADDMNQFGQKLNGANSQVNAMAKSAGTMLKQMSGSPSGLAQAMQQAQLQQQMQSAVRGGPQAGKNAMNLAAMMKQASSAGAPSSPMSMGSGSPSTPSGSKGQGKGKGGGMGSGGGEGGGSSDRNSMEGGKGMGSKAEVEQKNVRIDTKKIQAEALPGRRFTKNSSRSGWLYLDTWYVIGPWENKGKIDYGVIHPPEFEIDLSKTYLDGKKDSSEKPRALSWDFTQGSNMKIIPPEEKGNSTYYAWTEVYFDEGQEMMVAIASDDAAKVWINDMLVWEDHGQSGWNLDEGFRVVYFKKGYNKVLVRIENGPILCTFSLVLCPAPKGT